MKKETHSHSDQQRLTSEEFRLLLTQLFTVQNTQHLSSLQLQHDVSDRTSLQLAGQSRMLESGFAATSHNLSNIHSDVHNLQHAVQPVASQASYLSHLPKIQSAVERMIRSSSALSSSTKTF